MPAAEGTIAAAAADPAVYRFGSAEVNFDTWEAKAQGSPVRLTNLEMKLLRYLVDHEGKVVSRSELLQRVWGMARPPATRTIDTFMLNLRKYFEGDPSRPVHFLSVRGMGYRFVRRQKAAADAAGAASAETANAEGAGDPSAPDAAKTEDAAE